MKVTLCMTIYNRSDLLEKALENLIVMYPSGADHIVMYSDGASEEVLTVARKYSRDFSGVELVECKHLGIAEINNLAMEHARGNDRTISNDVIVRMDSDFYIESAGWAKKLGQFLVDHPEVGIAAPDWAGRYMRISRPDYDEIEYAMGAILAVRGSVYDELSDCHMTKYNKDVGAYHEGFFDLALSHQWDPDVCYRARMLGYRVGIIPVGNCIDLGAGTGDSSPAVLTKDTSPVKGGFQFLKKWNKHFTGQFRYKSPMMLRWDEFPLNYLWRRMWLAQFDNGYNVQPPIDDSMQGHRFEMIQFPITPTKWLLNETKESLKQNLVFKGEDTVRDTDLDLLTGKRGWTPADMQKN